MQKICSYFARIIIVGTSLGIFGCEKKDAPDAKSSAPSLVVNERIKIHDTNGDGALSEVEKAAMNQKFVAKFDTDGDGALSEKEMAEVRSKAKVNVMFPPKRTITNLEDAKQFLSRYDADTDGYVTEAEAGPDLWKVLQLADKNQDKRITPQEWLERR